MLKGDTFSSLAILSVSKFAVLFAESFKGTLGLSARFIGGGPLVEVLSTRLAVLVALIGIGHFKGAVCSCDVARPGDWIWG